MRVGLPLLVPGGKLSAIAEAARAAEAAGLSNLSCGDVQTDPMLQLTVAAGATQHIGLMTNIVVAFARSPMVLAQQGWALQEYSGGRLVMGLGSQVKAHIERRFSMPWSRPVARMAEYICAMRAIWSAWDSGDRLDFRGDFYSHTLMTPMFRPTGLRPAPKVYLAAVGEKMTEVVGEVADGLLLHPFTTPKYVRDVTLPALERGRACSGSDRSVEVVGGSFIVTGRTAEEFAESRSAVAERIAFYGSTPAYRPVFEAHGWADIGDELHRLSVSQDGDKWKRMGELISDEVLAEFAVVANPPDVGRAMQSRWGNVCSQYQLNTVGTTDTPFAMRVAATIRDS